MTSFTPGRSEEGGTVRLQKVLARAGVASRRAAEDLIAEGRVQVDDATVTRQGMKIDPLTSSVRVDGMRVVVDRSKVYLALNKPRGWYSTMSDDEGRPCIGDIVADHVEAGRRVFHVGRLDAATEGLILLTNDGELAHRLMHPSYEVRKTYLATVQGTMPRSIHRRLHSGVELDDGPVQVDEFAVLDTTDTQTLVRIVLHEGRKRVVRRLMKAVGHPVQSLVRTDVGPVALAHQKPGTVRSLDNKEIGALYGEVGL